MGGIDDLQWGNLIYTFEVKKEKLVYTYKVKPYKIALPFQTKAIGRNDTAKREVNGVVKVNTEIEEMTLEEMKAKGRKY